MNDRHSESWTRPPIPQVGAVLLLNDTRITSNHLRGSIDWILGGSATLVDWNRVLTIEHTVAANVPKAVFLPWEGIVPLRPEGLDPEDPRKGDDLVLASLIRPIETTPPMLHRKIRRRQKLGSFGIACGYGRWRGLAEPGRAGLQRTEPVTFGYPPFERQDNLDMSWYGPDNGGRQAGGGNSGGPMCWHPRNQGFRIVSITRESKDNLTIGSWIGQERDCWLRSKIGVIDATQQTDRHWTAFRHLELEGPDSIGTARVEVPAWASDARVTMNGTENHLQLASGFGVSDDALRERVQSHRSAGQFLSRQPSIEGGAEGDARTLSLAATYVGRPRRAEWPIRLQISVLAR